MDLTQILLAIIGLIGTVITAFAIPLIKNKTTEQQQNDIAKWVKIAVLAAEQVFNGSGLGTQKKDFVLKWLKDNGFNLDDVKIRAEIELLIEAFVAEMNKGMLVNG